MSCRFYASPRRPLQNINASSTNRRWVIQIFEVMEIPHNSLFICFVSKSLLRPSPLGRRVEAIEDTPGGDLYQP
jgi:hypothetical protein